MGLVSAIISIIAGVIYIGNQYRKEDPGGGSLILALWAAILPPWYIMMNTLPKCIAALAVKYKLPVLAFIVGIVGYGAIIAWYAYIFWYNPEENKVDELKLATEIWEEVLALPEPDIDTIIEYRAKLGLPTYPTDDKVRNKAAVDAWRNDQYNIRYKQRHDIGTYI